MSKILTAGTFTENSMKILLALFLSALSAFGAASTNVSFFKNIQANNIAVSTNISAGSLAVTNAITAATLDTGQGANELYDMDQDVMTTSSPTFPKVTLSPSGLLNIIGTNLATTPLAGLSLSNATPALVGAQVQDSPSLTWQGNAWLTGSASNAPVTFRSYVVPAAGSSTPSGTLILESSMNKGAFTGQIIFYSDGTILAPYVYSTAAGEIGFNTRARLVSGAVESIELLDSSRTKRATIQANVPQITKTANYTIAAALDSGLRFNNVGSSIATTNTLPTAVAAQHYWQYIDAAQIVSVKASGSDVIRWGSTVSAAAGDIWSSQVGSALHLFSPKAGLWIVDHAVGGWTLVSPRLGNSVLVGGTVTVGNTTCTANTIVLLTRKTVGGTFGTGGLAYTVAAGTGFTINSVDLSGVLSITDTSTVSWKLEEIPN